MRCPFWDDQLYVRIVQLPLGFPPTIMTVVPGGPNFGEGSRSCFFDGTIYHLEPTEPCWEKKYNFIYDETRIVDQRVHVLWQFNVDKPTKTYKNRLQHGRTWIILATENHFGSSSMFINDSSRLYSARCHCCQPKPLWKPTQQQQAAIWRERNGILSPKNGQ